MTGLKILIDLTRILVILHVSVCSGFSFSYEDLLLRCNNRRPPPQTLGECRYHENCMENAYCWDNQFCYCNEGYIVYRNESGPYCVKVATKIGDPCVGDIQCHLTFTPLSECRSNTCQCMPNAHLVGQRCYQSVGLGRVCQTNNNCYIKDSFCVDGYCSCNRNKHANPKRTSCVQNVGLGEPCGHDYECMTINTRCLEVCKCKVDYVASADSIQCLLAANSIGDPCQENSQCQEFQRGSICGPNHVCVCKEHHHRRGSMCIKDATLGQRCMSHRECVTLTYRDSNLSDIASVNCTNEVCTCAENYIMTDNKTDCIQFSENGATKWYPYKVFALIILLNFSLNML